MKKLISLFFLFFSLSILYPDEIGTFGISSGNINFGIRTGLEKYIYGHIINIMYQLDNGLGFTISPFFYSNGTNDSQFSTFVNVSLFYNVIKPFTDIFALQPFFSINMLSNSYPDFFELHSGLQFSCRMFFGMFFFEFLHIETGYTYNRIDKHGFYISMGIDLLGVFLALGQGAKDYYENRNPYLPN